MSHEHEPRAAAAGVSAASPAPAEPDRADLERERSRGAELCARVADGDARAFGDLISLYQRRIHAFCARMLQDPSEAEDLAQDVFLTVYQNAKEFRGESSFTTWIYRIARNQTLNRIKYLERRGRSSRKSLDDLGEERLESEDRAADDLVEGEQSVRLVRAAIEALPEQQKTVLILRDIEGLAYEEITEITGLALGTVKSRIHRARSALAEALSRKMS